MSKTEGLKSLVWEDIIQNGVTGKSGKKYLIEGNLSSERYYKLQEYMVELVSGKDTKTLLKKVVNAYQHLNAQGGAKVADASVELNDILKGFRSFGEGSKVAIKACCLYLNAEDETMEERLVFDETKMMQKVADLEAVYGFQGFFDLLSHLTGG